MVSGDSCKYVEFLTLKLASRKITGDQREQVRGGWHVAIAAAASPELLPGWLPASRALSLAHALCMPCACPALTRLAPWPAPLRRC